MRQLQPIVSWEGGRLSHIASSAPRAHTQLVQYRNGQAVRLGVVDVEHERCAGHSGFVQFKCWDKNFCLPKIGQKCHSGHFWGKRLFIQKCQKKLAQRNISSIFLKVPGNPPWGVFRTSLRSRGGGWRDTLHPYTPPYISKMGRGGRTSHLNAGNCIKTPFLMRALQKKFEKWFEKRFGNNHTGSAPSGRYNRVVI